MSTTQASVWFISAPANPTKDDTITKLAERLSPAKTGVDLAQISPFQLPDFKVGTLDLLMVLSDELLKADNSIEGVVVKLADTLRALVNNDPAQWAQQLLVGDSIIYLISESIDVYLNSFQWNTMKYRSDKTLKELADGIIQVFTFFLIQEVNTSDALIKTKLTAYNQTKGQLQTLYRKQT